MKKTQFIQTCLICGILSTALGLGGFFASQRIATNPKSVEPDTQPSKPLEQEPQAKENSEVFPTDEIPSSPTHRTETITPVLPEPEPDKRADAGADGGILSKTSGTVKTTPEDKPDTTKEAQALNSIGEVKKFLSQLSFHGIGPEGILINNEVVRWGEAIGPNKEVTLQCRHPGSSKTVIFTAFNEDISLRLK